MRIEQLRKEKGLSQEELSNIIGIKQKTLSNYENNDTSNKLNNFIKLANYFNVSLDYLCERPFNNQIGYIPEDRRELVKMIIDLDSSDIRAVTSYINGYLAGKSGNSNFKVFN